MFKYRVLRELYPDGLSNYDDEESQSDREALNGVEDTFSANCSFIISSMLVSWILILRKLCRCW